MLRQWDPFREMWNLRRVMDRMLDSAFDWQLEDWEPEAWGFPLDVAEQGEQYVVKASLPGINPDDVEVTLQNNTLSIRGEIQKEEAVEESRYHLRERPFGRFIRSVMLPTKVNADQIEASYENGELILHIPKAEEVRPRKIAIQSGSSQKMLEGRFESAAQES